MNMMFLGNLAVQTVTTPSEAARRLLSMNPGREVLWLAFFLAVVLNCLVQSGSGLLVATPDGGSASESIALFLAQTSGFMLLSIMALLFVGRVLGGVATFNDIMILMVWLQFLQVAASFITLILAIALPILMVMFVIAVFGLSLYVTIHFLNEAHKFQSLWKSFGVILLSALVAVPFVLALMPDVPV